jgi:plasmid stabilization system protein ParE
MAVKYKVIFAAKAIKHLESIYLYIATNTSQHQAERVFDALLETGASLQIFPESKPI